MAEKSHAYAEQIPPRFERDMGYNEKEFLRVLPAAIGAYQYRQDGQNLIISHPVHKHDIKLTVRPLPDRCLGAFRLQHIDVQFELLNMKASERYEFMQRFDRYFQRGGG